MERETYLYCYLEKLTILLKKVVGGVCFLHQGHFKGEDTVVPGHLELFAIVETLSETIKSDNSL